MGSNGDYVFQPNEVFDVTATMCLKACVELGIPEKVPSHGNQPITLTELVSVLNLHPNKTSNLHQLMRYLSFIGLFSRAKMHQDEINEDAYVLSPSSNLLLADHTDSKIAAAIVSAPSAFGYPHYAVTKAWENIGASLKQTTAQSAFEFVHGIDFWEYLKVKPDAGRVFDLAMKIDSKLFIDTALGDCLQAFEGLDSLVDVGGGTGALANSISQAFPQLNCTVLDQPSLVDNLDPQAKYDRLNYVAGDMFKSIPPADAILMKCVLHDWSDEECITVLKNCKAALSHKEGSKGKVIIIDIVINEDEEEAELTKSKLIYDMTMMVLLNGKERNEREWKLLFLKAGFTRYKITPLPGLRSLIQLFP